MAQEGGRLWPNQNQEGQVHLVRKAERCYQGHVHCVPNAPAPLGPMHLPLLGLNAVPLLLHLQRQG